MFSGQETFPVVYRGTKAQFSVKDAYSANFFGYYCQDGKTYEEAALNILHQNLRPKDIFVDVGSNIGYFTCLLSHTVDKGKVFSFEMGRENFKILNKNIGINRLGNVVTVNMAVSNEDGVERCVDAPVGSAVLKIIEEQDTKTDRADLTDVKSVSLDSYFSSAGIIPDVIKIDVEGAEIKVLKGMERLLALPDIKLLVEIHKKELKLFNSSEAEVRGILLKNGFNLQEMSNGERKYDLLFATKNSNR